MRTLATGVLSLVVVGCYAGLGAGDRGGDDDGAGGEEEAEESAGGDTGVISCEDGRAHPNRAPLRRMTRFEYNNTVRDLLGDNTSPANAFPSEEIGNGFGNDADAQAVSSLLAEQYATVAEGIAARATETPAALTALHACTSGVDDSSEAECLRAWLGEFLPRAYRRPITTQDVDELVALHQAVREAAPFPSGVAAVIEAVLQSPHFLYRVERGITDENGNRRPSGHEMASRLSYFFWGTMPDDALLAAAQSGELETDEGVRTHAERLLDHERSREVVRFFFDNLLPIASLSKLERDAEMYPTFSPQIGGHLREETQQFLLHEIYDDEGSGTWEGALTAPYTFVNEALAAYYGITGVTGESFQKVDIDTTQRLGLLTQAGMVAGTVHSNATNPVVRGAFVVQKVMCNKIPLPTGDLLDEVKPPDPYSGATARERFSQHSEDPVCAACHQMMDPVGFALENFDPVGLWRDQENGVEIDASGSLPGLGGFNGPVELARAVAAAPDTHECFAVNWSQFALGRTLDAGDECTQDRLVDDFVASGTNVRELLIAITQSDAFLYLPSEE